MTARKPVRLNYEALHRIRLAAGGFPANMDINELGLQLSKAIYDYQRWDSLRNIKPQKKRLEAIQKTASKLASLLKDDEANGVLDWWQQWPKDRPPPSKVAEEIQRMAEESGILETSPQKIIRDIKDENAVSGSAHEWLTTRLQEVFEQFFCPDFLGKRRFLDFTEAVCTEFGIRQPSRATVIRDRSRKGRSRRGRHK
jgi:hypothetical protein